MSNALTPSDVVAAKIRDLRKARKMTVADVAAGCAAAGMPELTAQVLYKLEQRRAAPKSGTRRPVSVDEVYALATALGCYPAELLPENTGPSTLGPHSLQELGQIAEALQGFVNLQQWRAENEEDSDGEHH
jgi:transcriptional regulator with XRE-family HTH domain